jgi:hypothetical protein
LRSLPADRLGLTTRLAALAAQRGRLLALLARLRARERGDQSLGGCGQLGAVWLAAEPPARRRLEIAPAGADRLFGKPRNGPAHVGSRFSTPFSTPAGVEKPVSSAGWPVFGFSSVSDTCPCLAP